MARTKPYTESGIRRTKCFRCGNPATSQWQICADNRIFRPICTFCDVELNRTVLEFMGFKNIDAMIERYEARNLYPPIQ